MTLLETQFKYSMNFSAVLQLNLDNLNTPGREKFDRDVRFRVIEDHTRFKFATNLS